MKPKIGNRIRTTAITLAAAGLFGLVATYGSVLAQDSRIASGLKPTMGYLFNMPRQPFPGEGLDDFLAGRLDEFEIPLYEVRGEPSTGVVAAICTKRDSDGNIILGQRDDSGKCNLPE